MAHRPIPLAILDGLAAVASGLTEHEAAERLGEFGPNDIVEAPSHPWRALIADTAKDPMLWFFSATAGLYALVGQHSEAVTLVLAILPLLGMDVYLHRRTQASTEGLTSRLATTATVVRNGVTRTLPTIALVPGDRVVVSIGEPFPADVIIVAGADLQVDESALTGEAFPVAKRPLDAQPPRETSHEGAGPRVAEAHWGFAGTRLLTGHAQACVAHTGGATLYGEIARSALGGGHERTPIQAAIDHLVRRLLVVAIALCVVLAAVRLAQGNSWLDALVSAVTLATAAIPEEFPVVFTFYLSVGVYRLARRQALVRRAVTVENIGRVTCICSDKTGTITEGRLQLTHVLPAPGTSAPRLLEVARAAARAETGDPLDEAILLAAGATTDIAPASVRVTTFPFTEDRQRETAVVETPAHERWVATKGAAEVVMAMCDAVDGAVQAERTAAIQAFATDAHKVVAVAWRPLDAAADVGTEPASGYRFAGLLAFEDPVREGVREAVTACRVAGIHTIMVTGDHPVTAAAVARAVGLGGREPRVVLGDALEAMVADGLGGTLRDVDVVARAKPAQKLLLVKTLQSLGEIVAVTGDGVNDVPALQAADIGVAMGARGTRSAREVAAIVLMDDNFRTIVGAIGEGRQLFQNLQISFQYLLITHIPLVLTAALIPLAGYPLLYLPTHIVWLEMLIHPTAMLVFQALPTRDLVPHARSVGRARFFDPVQMTTIVVTGLLVAAAVTAGYLRSLGVVADVDHGRAMALATFTLASAGVTAGLSGLRSRAAWFMCLGTLASSWLLIQTPAVAAKLHLRPLDPDDWALALGGAIIAGAIPWLARWIRG
ncbi:MAG: cation-transporting P-type ATPase [Ardenticatenales bacterium]|nr:cation-transporting P-type ATPase [Ardenticatenales bacterium]